MLDLPEMTVETVRQGVIEAVAQRTGFTFDEIWGVRFGEQHYARDCILEEYDTQSVLDVAMHLNLSIDCVANLVSGLEFDQRGLVLRNLLGNFGIHPKGVKKRRFSPY